MPKSNKTDVRSGKKPRNIYMDYAASFSPNPSSIHSLGLEAKTKLQNARKKVADVLNVRASEVIFTSGGTESNNLAIQGVVYAAVQKNTFLNGGDGSASHPEKKYFSVLPHLVTTNIEHPSVLETFRLLEKRGLVEISIVTVESNGIVDPKKIKKEIKDNTVLVSVMYANNEIGTIQPIKEIANEIRHIRKSKEKNKNFERSSDLRVPLPARPFQNLHFSPLLHTDAVQAVNYLDLNIEKLGVDLLSLSGSKIEDAGRVGVLYKKKSVELENIYGGGDQELGLRPGTENLSEIVKFANAFEKVEKEKTKESKRTLQLRNYFIKKLKSFSVVTVNGDLENRLPNNVNITIHNIPSDLLVIELSVRGVMVSSKSACKSESEDGSYVIKAIHPEANSEIGGLRFSFGRKTTKSDIDYTLKSLSAVLTKLKKWYT